MRLWGAILLLLCCVPGAVAQVPPPQRQGRQVLIPAGVLKPFYPPSENEKEIAVSAFWLDKQPVTEGEFLEFVKKNEAWQRGRAPKILVDDGYLSHWKSIRDLGQSVHPNQPVTRVSWYAAKAYCESVGGRLPGEFEWELAAQASYDKLDASRDMEWRRHLLDAYSVKPLTLGDVAQNKPNAFGLYDMHELVWEWIQDFNGSLLKVDSRDGKDGDKLKFCGAGSLEASEREDYPSFIRMAFRNSLKANYTTHNLGFRCAKDQK